MGNGEEWPTTHVRVRRLPGGVRMILVVLGDPIAGAHVRWLCERVRVLLGGSDAEVVVCDVAALVEPDLGAVDALARLQLTVGRLGRRVLLRHASPELRDLLAFVGLGDVVPTCASGLQLSGQAEQREQAGGVQERDDPDDPAV